MDFENAKARLKQTDENGQSLYDHVTKLLLKINQEKPADALDKLEALSVAVKNNALVPPSFKEVPETPVTQVEKQKVINAESAKLKLFENIPKITAADRAAVEASLRAAAAAEDDEDGAKEKAQALLPAVMKGAHIPNLLGSNNLLKAAGSGLSKETIYSIFLSLKGLAARHSGIASLRFFGKIFGTKSDYYIAEAKYSGKFPRTEDPVTKKEPRGVSGSANEFVYFVTNDPSGDWEELPDVLPEQIMTARKMKRFMTGNLRAAVGGHPRFPWPEASFLRAQIARIAAATTISPKGYFTMEAPEDEEDEDAPEEMKADAEFEAPSSEDLITAEGWCHHRAFIFKMGRTKKWEAPEAEDGEEEEEPPEGEEEEEEEEGLPMLSGLEGDESKLTPVLWKFSGGSGAFGTTSVKSIAWPGAVAVAKGAAFANFYAGWAQKFTGSIHQRPALPPVAGEYKSNFNPEEAEEDETDPTLEQTDPPPPKDAGGDDDGEGDEGDEDEE